MKVFSMKAGRSGAPSVTVTGSTSVVGLNQGRTHRLDALWGGSARGRGVAVSVLPDEYQRRLSSGGQITPTEFNALDYKIVE